jgi:hypothetical protein
MKEEMKINKEPSCRVAVSVVPCPEQADSKNGNTEVLNRVLNSELDAPCRSTVNLAVMNDGSKLTKADAGRLASLTDEVYVSVRVLPVEDGCMPVVEMNVSEKCFMTFQEER